MPICVPAVYGCFCPVLAELGSWRRHLSSQKHLLPGPLQKFAAPGLCSLPGLSSLSPKHNPKGFPDSSVGKESSCNAGDPGSIPGSGKIPWRRDRLPAPVFLGFSGGSDCKGSASNAGDLGLIPGSGKLPWRRAWQPIPIFLPGESPYTEESGRLQSIAKSQTRLTKHNRTYSELIEESSYIVKSHTDVKTAKECHIR